MKYSLTFHPSVFNDVEEISTYYKTKSEVVANKFIKVLQKHYNSIKTTPFFQIRYDDVRCLPIHKFPYMIHFSVNEQSKTVFIKGVYSTHEHPDKNWNKR